MKRRFELLDLVRLTAILLVLNSHCDALYPIPALATGGAAGNSLFFLISGYLLKVRADLPGFLKNRAARLYPGVFLVVTLDLILGRGRIGSGADLFRKYIWPTSFWFIGAIILFDLLIWFLEKADFTRQFRAFTGGMAVLYTVSYIFVVDKTQWSIEQPGLATPAQCFKLICYFYIYVLGYYGKKQVEGGVYRPGNRMLYTLGAFLAFLASFGIKAVFVKWPAALQFQFVSHLLNIVFCWFTLQLVLNREKDYEESVPAGCRRGIRFLASLSLEVYLLQFLFIDLFTGLRFPVNLFLVLAATFGSAYILHRVTSFLYSRIR